MKDEITVSIICNTYNHGKYIRDALEGFVMQKTSFRYEVLIHDDASMDCTPEIIKEYAKNYPEIIKPIFQKENQYSQNIPISRTYQYPRAKGKYIAYCEGDDYWTDGSKLQKQVDLMEKHPEINICSHSSSTIDANTGKVISVSKKSDKKCIIPANAVIKGGGGFVATSSLLYRTPIMKNIPEFRMIIDMDYTAQIHGSLNGGMLYIPDEMSVYRSNVSGSWTQRARENVDYKIEHRKKVLKMLRQLDIDTNGKYHSEIVQVALRVRAKMLVSRMKLLKNKTAGIIGSRR